MFPIYKFDLTIGATTKRAYPIYSENFSKEYELETGQRFFREKLSGKLTFERKDYTRITAAAFDTRFLLTIYISSDGGVTWTEYVYSEFWKTDCEFDQDAQTVTVTPKVIDKYDSIMSGIDNEYNLIELLPEIVPVMADKRPMVQIYIPGESVISCYLSGMWWEEECETVEEYVEEGGETINQLISHYKFGLNVRELIISAESNFQGLPDVFFGQYPTTPQTNRSYVNGDYTFVYRSEAGSGYIRYYFEIARSSDNVVMWRYSATSNPAFQFEPWSGDFYTLSPVAGTGASGNVTITWRSVAFYTRFITDVPVINHVSLLELPKDDLALNHNYKYVYPYGRTDIIYFSGNLSNSPTQWGVYDLGKYYVPPTVYLNPELFPVSRKLWGRVSYWFGPYRFDEADETAGRKLFEIKNTYLLSSAINVLLKKIGSGMLIGEGANAKYNTYINGSVWSDPISSVYCELIPLRTGKSYTLNFNAGLGAYALVYDSLPTAGDSVNFVSGYTTQVTTVRGQTVIIDGVDGQFLYVRADSNPNGRVFPEIITNAPHHLPTTDYSQFLYGENPITHIEQTLLITPKTNVKSSGYDRPAEKAPITLRVITEMLRDCFRCYWFLDSSGRFRIEHISYFMNGGSYSETPVVGIDLTALKSRRSGKEWSFAKNQYKYNKPEMAARYQFGWMDDETQLFNGYSIEIQSKYVVPDKIEEIRIGSFSSDFDYILLNPSAISNDGFVLMAAYYDGGSPSQIETIPWNSAGMGSSNTRWYRYLAERVQEGDVLDFSLLNYTDYECAIVVLTQNTWGEGEVVSVTGWQSQDIHKVVDSIEGGYFCRVVIRKKDDSSMTLNEGNGLVNVLSAERYEEGTPARFRLPYIDYVFNNTSHKLQNAWVAFNYLQQYYAYDMPARNYTINGVAKVALGLKKLKTQQINFPLFVEPNFAELVKTGIGNGMIEKMSVNLSNRNAKATLIYDTE